MAELDRLLKVREAAEVLGVSQRFVYESTLTGALPRVKVGVAVRIPQAALARWIEQHTELGPDDRR